jgi:hypothetical protein
MLITDKSFQFPVRLGFGDRRPNRVLRADEIYLRERQKTSKRSETKRSDASINQQHPSVSVASFLFSLRYS